MRAFNGDAERAAFIAGAPIERNRICPFKNGNSKDRCSGHAIKFAGHGNPDMEQWLAGDEADWPKEPIDFFSPEHSVPAPFAMTPDTDGDLGGFQTVPNRLAPERLWLASGEKINLLSETSTMEVVLGGYDHQRYVALHPESSALVAFTSDSFNPSVALRIASRKFWEAAFGEDWWLPHNIREIFYSLMGQAIATRLIWTQFVSRQAPWHIDEALDRMVVFHPEALDRWAFDTPDLKVIGFNELISRDFPKSQCLLDPWLTLPGLCMIFAERGVGKTMFVCSVALAVSTGNAFLCWKAGRPRRALVIDGEMTASDLKARYSQLAASMQCDPQPENLAFLCADLCPTGLPDLGSEEGQQALESYLQGFDLIVIDNLSTLVRSGAENEADSWGVVQAWAIRQRSAGRSILLVHHSGKNGAQRGTSRREDVLGTVIQLKRPAGYHQSDGAKFEVHFTKARGFYGSSAEPIEAHLKQDGQWSWASVNQAQVGVAAELFQHGETVRDIATKLGVSTSTISKRLNEAGLKPQRGRRPKSD